MNSARRDHANSNPEKPSDLSRMSTEKMMARLQTESVPQASNLMLRPFSERLCASTSNLPRETGLHNAGKLTKSDPIACKHHRAKGPVFEDNTHGFEMKLPVVGKTGSKQNLLFDLDDDDISPKRDASEDSTKLNVSEDSPKRDDSEEDNYLVLSRRSASPY